ncbi:hypothetical protein B9N62_04335 [Campylobacter concisus]|uniref:Uncharacterized protein n=1 Tax=Campylobacter concisus TaxID=199 RepID=A0A1Y5MTH3_9BACT|nr:hypothetical protein B9N62_04335 [Campylobacter concisus]
MLRRDIWTSLKIFRNLNFSQSSIKRVNEHQIIIYSNDMEFARANRQKLHIYLQKPQKPLKNYFERLMQ